MAAEGLSTALPGSPVAPENNPGTPAAALKAAEENAAESVAAAVANRVIDVAVAQSEALRNVKVVTKSHKTLGDIPLSLIGKDNKRRDIYLRPAAALDFLAMVEDARAQGVTLSISEGWRTYEEQAALKTANPRKAAAPGTSKHERGYAVDLDVGAGGRTYFEPPSDARYRYLLNNAAKFGFIGPLKRGGRVYEAWHWEHPSDAVEYLPVESDVSPQFIADSERARTNATVQLAKIVEQSVAKAPTTKAERAKRKAAQDAVVASRLATAGQARLATEDASKPRPVPQTTSSDRIVLANDLKLYNVELGGWGAEGDLV
jgi:LAS superfamily LD-carboxypeptidase LdcB